MSTFAYLFSFKLKMLLLFLIFLLFSLFFRIHFLSFDIFILFPPLISFILVPLLCYYKLLNVIFSMLLRRTLKSLKRVMLGYPWDTSNVKPGHYCSTTVFTLDNQISQQGFCKWQSDIRISRYTKPTAVVLRYDLIYSSCGVNFLLI